MPELPEVEVTCKGIRPYSENEIICEINLHHRKLRWDVSDKIFNCLKKPIVAIERRAKYILVKYQDGYLIIHLGMSGTLRVNEKSDSLIKHDHIEFILKNGNKLVFNDPRRFGFVLWKDINEFDAYFSHLGPEPLSEKFDTKYLSNVLKKSKSNIKQVIMNQKTVVGVGNIYANEALFESKISPLRIANQLKKLEIELLVKNIKIVLQKSINQGGTTLKDFKQANGKPGYFVQELSVYGRKDQPCMVCGNLLKEVRINNRTSVYCDKCQH
ncbi:DNA-formamidopyrimidine glycosylase [Paraphotobacterium marinum]|uniref:Formamidopyrimidine-DNA glycosylase n=1 Tax=Paraphotobacterium marinum TaxID=1755811 RepID=A0A220VCC3_9GAMM|nr:bifunctional DNA-formamidopyrimidine glycosylase/DNA-(apurinic or apyrimidinic site) lyase [Paraphotobacterium marinum]ASK78058.1 DNA-formamidopyrimidine glycosylase [Paraphotobacterium marinum]